MQSGRKDSSSDAIEVVGHLSRIPDKDAEVVSTKILFVSLMKFDLLQLAYEHNLHISIIRGHQHCFSALHRVEGH